jgi:hexulose-6-phosphate isomerase
MNMLLVDRIGFMQGRLSDQFRGKIQSFPWGTWTKEFEIGCLNNYRILEWTLDIERIHENPIMTEAGRKLISKLKERFQINIPSMTADFIMQAPFWKASNDEMGPLKSIFLNVLSSCSIAGVEIVVVPLVDNGEFDSLSQRNRFVEFILCNLNLIVDLNIKIAFETSLPPFEYLNFLNMFGQTHNIGVNYDLGNSASLGFEPTVEVSTLNKKIINVHLKDRKLYGQTVPFGRGDTDFLTAWRELKKIGYEGNFIIQGARSDTKEHVQLLNDYRKYFTDITGGKA